MDGRHNSIYRFKTFTLDIAERQLTQDSEPIPLTPKAFDVLVLLVENRGHLVTKDELIASVWPDSFVEETNLARAVHTLRRTLGQDNNGNKFIETVPTKGYRFVADVTLDEGGNEGLTAADDPSAGAETDDTVRVPRFLWISCGFLFGIGLILLLSFYLQPSPGPGERGTANDEALRYVQQAAHTIDKSGSGSAAKALELTDKAIALDPNYARAYTVRASAYAAAAWQPEKLGLATKDCYLRAREAVETAIRLDSNSSDAYAMLGRIKDTYEWRSEEADAAYRRAIDLDPRNAAARRHYAFFLMASQRFDESIQQMDTAIELEPASIFGQRSLGLVYSRAGRYDEAIAQLKRVREMEPQVYDVSGVLWQSHYLKGDTESAYREFKAQFSRNPDNAERLAKLGEAYSTSGWQGIFQAEKDVYENGGELLRVGDAQFGPVIFYTALGESDKAIAALEKQAEGPNRAAVVFMGRWLDPLRTQPRFQALMKKIGY